MGSQKIADELYLKFGIQHSPETIRKYRLPISSVREAPIHPADAGVRRVNVNADFQLDSDNQAGRDACSDTSSWSVKVVAEGSLGFLQCAMA